MPKDPFVREKLTRELSYARKLAREYFEKYPKEKYQTEVESWQQIQSYNIEFTMKRLREPIEAGEPFRQQRIE
jgi:hypothetical protein